MASQPSQQSLVATRPTPENGLRIPPPEVRNSIFKYLADHEVLDTYDLPNILRVVDNTLYKEAFPIFKDVFTIQKYTATTEQIAELKAMSRRQRLSIKHLKLVDPSPANLTK